jgi:hypothetical protein
MLRIVFDNIKPKKFAYVMENFQNQYQILEDVMGQYPSIGNIAKNKFLIQFHLLSYRCRYLVAECGRNAIVQVSASKFVVVFHSGVSYCVFFQLRAAARAAKRLQSAHGSVQLAGALVARDGARLSAFRQQQHRALFATRRMRVRLARFAGLLLPMLLPRAQTSRRINITLALVQHPEPDRSIV